MQRTSKTYNIRLQVVVEAGSLEDLTLEFLNDEKVRPFGKSQMILTALKPYWSTLAMLSKDFSLEQVMQALCDGNYLWELHKQYLRERIESKNLGSQSLLTRAELAENNQSHAVSPTRARNTLVEQGSVAADGERGNATVKSVAAQVVEDEATIESQPKPFNPFGDEAIVRY